MATRGRRRKGGRHPWLAHWREDNGRQRTKSFETREAALAWEDQKRREKDARILDERTRRHETLLEDWIREWWDLHMKHATLNTRLNYSLMINKYLGPELGKVPMALLRPHRIAEMRDELLERGETPGTVGRAIVVLSSCLGKAVERGHFDVNPCRGVSKPSERKVRKNKWPPAPLEIELLRREFLSYRAPNSGPWIALRSATIVSVMAYAGLRPEEVMGLKLGAFDPGARILRIEDVFSVEHRPGDTKTHCQRVVELLDVVAEDLALWIDAAGLDDPEAWLFPPSPGADVAVCTHRNWAARPWKRARDRVVAEHPEFKRSLGQATPKDLRGACVSLFARAGHSDADIAEMTGHSVGVLREHYLGAIKTLRRLPVLSEAEQIRNARKNVRIAQLQGIAAEARSEAANNRQCRPSLVECY